MTIQELENRVNAQATKLSVMEQQLEKQKRLSQKLMLIVAFMLIGVFVSLVMFASDPASWWALALSATTVFSFIQLTTLFASYE